MAEIKKGSFTLPGEAGFESLTLKMAEKWGADVIRDSDGTKLSEDITKAHRGRNSPKGTNRRGKP